MLGRVIFMLSSALFVSCDAAVILNRQPFLPYQTFVNYINPSGAFSDARHLAAPDLAYPFSSGPYSRMDTPSMPTDAFVPNSQLSSFGSSILFRQATAEDPKITGGSPAQNDETHQSAGMSYQVAASSSQTLTSNNEPSQDQQQQGQTLILVPETLEELMMLAQLTQALAGSGATAELPNLAVNDVDNDEAGRPAAPTIVTEARINSKSPSTELAAPAGFLPNSHLPIQFESRSVLPNSFPYNSLMPTVTLDLQDLGLSVGTASTFPQPTAATGFANVIGGTVATLRGRVYFYQPSSSSVVYVTMWLGLLEAGGTNTYSIQVFTNANLPLSCTALGAEYTPGGLTGLVGTIIQSTLPNSLVFAGTIRAFPALSMTLLGQNSAFGHSIGIVNVGTGAIVACGAITQTTNS